MHTLSMIDASSKGYEAIAPAKPAQPKRESFDRVFNDRHAQRAERPERPERADKPERIEQSKPAERSERPVKAAEEKAVAQQPPVAERKPLVGKDPEQAVAQASPTAEPTVSQLLVALLNNIAGGETAESLEQSGSSEELLTQLLTQLDSSGLQDEQLSALVEQLQTISAAEGGEEQLSQLVAQLEEQLSSAAGLLANAELAATSMPGTDPQLTSQPLSENLAQVRQVLQKTLDAVARQNRVADQQVVIAEQEGTEQEGTEQKLLLDDAGEAKIDPRFASLLKPREMNSESLRERFQANPVKPAVAQGQSVTADVTQSAVAVNPEQAVEELAELVATKPQQRVDNPLQQLSGSAQLQNQSAMTGRSMPTTAPTMQLPSGQQVAESQVFDQVVTRMSGGFNGESGKMVLRLQPAELGTLRLELTVEGDKVRASLLAQTQQVQEVLERNLPQLRSALAEQGLKIDQFLVDVDKRQEQPGQFEQQAQQQKQNQPQQPAWQQNWQDEEQQVPLAHLLQNGGGGISLHV